ncbi:uncharacterized protein LY79DRAFT_584126 [Colletotrichum navitas]|uniref:Uncharacterized protein n=1 Tax=Colletotrichum navitas TaxID=681940 RepID=A0AAD8UZX1_9PEZI|nr:uncharacterized protein LY79DRAFT_584126 [Colletotrichum navitas]KAK1570274.1 hypothetical protein LY79DRAFT_584126 [Colletotrichum navitas]
MCCSENKHVIATEVFLDQKSKPEKFGSVVRVLTRQEATTPEKQGDVDETEKVEASCARFDRSLAYNETGSCLHVLLGIRKAVIPNGGRGRRKRSHMDKNGLGRPSDPVLRGPWVRGRLCIGEMQRPDIGEGTNKEGHMSELDESCGDGEQTTAFPLVGKLNRDELGEDERQWSPAIWTAPNIVLSVPKAMPSRVNVLWWVVPREPEAAQQRRSSAVPTHWQVGETWHTNARNRWAVTQADVRSKVPFPTNPKANPPHLEKRIRRIESTVEVQPEWYRYSRISVYVEGVRIDLPTQHASDAPMTALAHADDGAA